MTDNRLAVESVESTVHLHWSGTADLDLLILVQQGDAKYRLFSFADEGTLKINPYVQLLSDFAFEEIPTDNQEIVRIDAHKIESATTIWFFCWDFEYVEKETTAPFFDHEVSLELR